MKICFIGTVIFSARVFEHLLRHSVEIAGLITSEKNDFNADFEDLSLIATRYRVPVLRTDDINSLEALRWLKSIDPDVIFCFGWSRLLKAEVLRLPRLGVVGFHPAELPMNRGRHPLIWALVLGLPHTASTFFFMDEGADSGDILSQVYVPIAYHDNAKTLYDKIVDTAIRQIDQFVPQLVSGKYQRIKQDHSTANTWRKRGVADGKIDFRMPARGIYNLVRGLTKPYVGAHLEQRGKKIFIWEVSERPDDRMNIEPGSVVFCDEHVIHVKCGIDAVEIKAEYFDKAPNLGDYLQ